MTTATTTRIPRLGLLTVPNHFGQQMAGLSGIADAMNFASTARYNTLQVAMFPTKSPDGTKRDFAAETLVADWVLKNADEVRPAVAELVARTGVTINSVCFCANPLGGPQDREHLKKVIDAAPIVGAEQVVTFIGNPHSLFRGDSAKKITWGRDMKGTELKIFYQEMLLAKYAPLLAQARANKVVLGIENCPMMKDMDPSRWHELCNYFADEESIDATLEVLPGLMMHFDPSHPRNYRSPRDPDEAATQTILRFIKKYGTIIAPSLHLKDGEDDIEGMQAALAIGRVFEGNRHTQGLWKARAPIGRVEPYNGQGRIDWVKFYQNLPSQVTAVNVELEDLDARNWDDNKALFVRTAQFQRDHALKTVFGETGDSGVALEPVNLDDIQFVVMPQ